MQETWVQSLGWKDPLEKGKTTYSSILAWRISWTYGPWSRKESDTTERLSRLIKVASFPEVVIFMDFECLFPLHPKNEVYPQRATWLPLFPSPLGGWDCCIHVSPKLS